MYGIKGRFRISSIKFPIYIEIITAQKICGSSVINLGPGLTFNAIKAPNNIAVVPDPGIPSVRGVQKIQYKQRYSPFLEQPDL